MLHFAKITEDDDGNETYGTPENLAKAISADLSVELVEAILYADDGIAEIVRSLAMARCPWASMTSARLSHPRSPVRPSTPMVS